MNDASQTLIRFNRLMRDLDNGETSRTSFVPWEVELLLDLDSCGLSQHEKRRVLRRYQKAAQRRIEAGFEPLKLSEYLGRRRHAACAATTCTLP